MIGVAIYVVRRVARAWVVVFLLLSSREVARQLPWPYIRERVRRDPIIWLQFGSIIALYLVWPAGLVHGAGSGAPSPLIYAAMVLFALGPFSNWLRNMVSARSE